MEDVCKVCGEKLEKKDDSALYYCMKCKEAQKHMSPRGLENIKFD